VLETAKSALRLQTQIESAAHRGLQPDCPELLTRHFLLESFVRPNLSRLYDAGLPAETQITVVNDAAEMIARVRASPNVFALFRGEPPSDSDIHSVLLAPATLSIYASPVVADAIRSGARSMESVPFLLPRSNPTIREFVTLKLSEAEFEPKAFFDGSPFAENWAELIVDGQAIALFYDKHVSDLVERKLLEPIPPKIPSSWMVLAANRSADRKLFLSIVEACRIELESSGFN
jgi:DNA-binding transcriptional LysR family regulator